MSDVKISQLPTAIKLNSADWVPIVQNGTTKKVSAGNFSTGTIAGVNSVVLSNTGGLSISQNTDATGNYAAVLGVDTSWLVPQIQGQISQITLTAAPPSGTSQTLTAHFPGGQTASVQLGPFTVANAINQINSPNNTISIVNATGPNVGLDVNYTNATNGQIYTIVGGRPTWSTYTPATTTVALTEPTQNTLQATVNGVASGPVTLVNSVSGTYTNGNLVVSVNGQSSGNISIPPFSSFTNQLSTLDNTITSDIAVNGTHYTTTTPAISSNSLGIANGTITSTVNGIASSAALPAGVITSNVLAVNPTDNNTLTSTVNGTVSNGVSIIRSGALSMVVTPPVSPSYSSTLTLNINGLSTSVQLPEVPISYVHLTPASTNSFNVLVNDVVSNTLQVVNSVGLSADANGNLVSSVNALNAPAVTIDLSNPSSGTANASNYLVTRVGGQARPDSSKVQLVNNVVLNYDSTTGAFTTSVNGVLSNQITITSGGGGGSGVTDIASNGGAREQGHITLNNGTGISVTDSGGNFTFNNTGLTSVTGSSKVTGDITFTGAGVSQSGNTFTFSGGGGSGTLTNVILNEPGWRSVSSSTVSGVETVTVTDKNQNANNIFAGLNYIAIDTVWTGPLTNVTANKTTTFGIDTFNGSSNSILGMNNATSITIAAGTNFSSAITQLFSTAGFTTRWVVSFNPNASQAHFGYNGTITPFPLGTAGNQFNLGFNFVPADWNNEGQINARTSTASQQLNGAPQFRQPNPDDILPMIAGTPTSGQVPTWNPVTNTATWKDQAQGVSSVNNFTGAVTVTNQTGTSDRGGILVTNTAPDNIQLSVNVGGTNTPNGLAVQDFPSDPSVITVVPGDGITVGSHGVSVKTQQTGPIGTRVAGGVMVDTTSGNVAVNYDPNTLAVSADSGQLTVIGSLGAVSSIQSGITGTRRQGAIVMKPGTNTAIVDNNDNSFTFNVSLGVQQGGTAVSANATTLNFTGAGVTATSRANNVVEINIPGGGGGGGSNFSSIVTKWGSTGTASKSAFSSPNNPIISSIVVELTQIIAIGNVTAVTVKLSDGTNVATLPNTYTTVTHDTFGLTLTIPSADIPAAYQTAANVIVTFVGTYNGASTNFPASVTNPLVNTQPVPGARPTLSVANVTLNPNSVYTPSGTGTIVATLSNHGDGNADWSASVPPPSSYVGVTATWTDVPANTSVAVSVSGTYSGSNGAATGLAYTDTGTGTVSQSTFIPWFAGTQPTEQTAFDFTAAPGGAQVGVSSWSASTNNTAVVGGAPVASFWIAIDATAGSHVFTVTYQGNPYPVTPDVTTTQTVSANGATRTYNVYGFTSTSPSTGNPQPGISIIVT